MADKKSNKKVPPSDNRSGGIRKRLITNNVLIVFIMIIVIFTIVGWVIYQSYYNSVQSSLELRANTQANYINKYMTSSYSDFYNYSSEAAKNFSESDRLEMQVLDENGRIMFSSTGITAGYLPQTGEIQQAYANGKTSTFRGYDRGIDDNVIAATAVIKYRDDTIIGGVRYVSSTRALHRQLISTYTELAISAAAVMVIILLTNFIFLESIVNPILGINKLAKKISRGQLGARMDMKYNDEIGELCHTINDMSEELARSEKIKNEFISSVSHELRTPLTAINGWTDTVSESLDDRETALIGLGIIKKEASRLSQMVEELLDFSRIESGAMKLQMEVLDIRGEVYDAVFTYNELFKAQNLTVKYDEADEAVMVCGDKNRLKQVFLNILDNAAKYGADGESVDVSVYKKNGKCFITVADHGQGIPEAELPHVKEKFFKGSARGRGTGIGLSVCNEIVALHGGELDIFSKVGNGTTVTVTLPGYSQENK